MSARQETPMMAQYRKIRRELPEDSILFFRLGDFYEMFFEDAKVAAEILDITLTQRHGVPMCGVPFHSASSYLERLVRAGRKVAICEQMEGDPSSGGVVKRDITRVVTPGTILDEVLLEDAANNYLAALLCEAGSYGTAMLDLSTGECWVEEFGSGPDVEANMARYRPSECLVSEEQRDRPAITSLQLNGVLLTVCEAWLFDLAVAEEALLRHYKVHSLEGFGRPAASSVAAAGAMIHHVKHNLRRNLAHVRTLRVKNAADYMLLDEATATNLELIAPLSANRKAEKTTVLGVLDSTCTAMGGRLLREWLLRPLNRLDRIQARHAAVALLAGQQTRLRSLRDLLKGIKDVERLISRIGSSSGNPRDVRAIGTSLAQLPLLQAALSHQGTMMGELGNALQTLPGLVQAIGDTLKDEPPAHLREGGVIRAGFHQNLDELRDAAASGRKWLAGFQIQEAERSGIKSLKVRHNKVFGYYIEIGRNHLDQVPDHYVRRQTLAGVERFVVPELKEYENKIVGAQERAIALEQELFAQLRTRIAADLETIQKNARIIAQIDVLAAFAERALTLRYARPEMNDSGKLIVQDGRHAVVEQMPGGERFVPNDTRLDRESCQLMVITGPNMAGKSTYIRQVALITILAHMGCFVPAVSAEIGLVDRVFTRVGASDDLARGRSTFMVEMQETAHILNNATPRSLIVLDEIGRGTSTFDGISIAWSVAEYLCRHDDARARTLFATHYHELTELAAALPRARNYSVMVRERGQAIIFLRKVAAGPADKSYGIQVARLAGLPEAVVARAGEILSHLEEEKLARPARSRPAKKRAAPKLPSETPLDLL